MLRAKSLLLGRGDPRGVCGRFLCLREFEFRIGDGL